MLKTFWKDECGQDMVEYALVVGVIALGAIVGLQGVRTAIQGMFTTLTGRIGTANTAIQTP